MFNVIIPILSYILRNHSFPSISVPISVLCQRSQGDFRQNMPRSIDGAVVVSRNERDVDCIATFQTGSILEKFMIRFIELNIDCMDTLEIYDSAHIYGNLKVGSKWKIQNILNIVDENIPFRYCKIKLVNTISIVPLGRDIVRRDVIQHW